MTETPRIVTYARQSEQRPGESAISSLSVRSQQERGRAWAASIGGTIVSEIVDHDLRGWDPDRPGIQQLITTAKTERVDVVWFFALSRLARDLILQLMICRDLERAGVARIVSDTEGGIDDPFVRGIHGLMNEQATRQTSAHLKAAFARRARDGGFPTGPTPTGYRRPHTITITRANGTSFERRTGEPVIEPEGAAIILDLYERFDEGASLHELACLMAERGPGPRGGQWERSTIKSMLTSPIYAGDISHKGAVVAHNDAWAIVPRDLWDRVQGKISRLVVVRRNEIDSWLEGLVYHSCGKRMYWQKYQGQNKGPGGMFICAANSAPVDRCMQDRRIIGAGVLETAVRRCLLSDFAHVRTPVEALTLAQERTGGGSAVKHRAAIAKRLRDAQARWHRMAERFALGKLPASVMDDEDAKLAQAEREHADALAALPVPLPEADVLAMNERMTEVARVISMMMDDDLRWLLADLGRVVVGGAGVTVEYLDSVAPHVTGSTLFVPVGGRGFR